MKLPKLQIKKPMIYEGNAKMAMEWLLNENKLSWKLIKSFVYFMNMYQNLDFMENRLILLSSHWKQFFFILLKTFSSEHQNFS